MAVFYVTLSPLEPYFFGSERKLGDGFSNTRSSYFVQSELVPQQSTLLGMLRFFLLKQAGYVRDDYRTDEELIGKNSFMISSTIRVQRLLIHRTLVQSKVSVPCF